MQPSPDMASPDASVLILHVDLLFTPASSVSQAKRESVATVAFQIWLFGISIVAILTESIPHVLVHSPYQHYH